METTYRTGEHSYTTVRHQSFGSQLGGSCCGVGFGVILTLIAPVLLWWNEGHAVSAFEQLDVLRYSTHRLPTPKLYNEYVGKFVHAQGEIEGATITDNVGPFTFEIHDAAVLQRSTSMFQWREHSRSSTKTNMDGSKTTVTNYDYTQEWSSSHHDSQRFHVPGGHQNPSMIPSTTSSADSIRLGGLSLGSEVVSQLSAPTPVRIEEGMVKDRNTNLYIGTSEIYVGYDSNRPQIGDHRVSYKYLPNGKAVSIIGVLQEDGYLTGSKYNSQLPLVALGHATIDDLVDAAQSSLSIQVWLLRVLGWILMTFGLNLIVGPLTTIIGVIPIIGSITNNAAGLVIALLSFCLCLCIIAASWIAHRPGLALSLLGAAMVLLYFEYKGTQPRHPAPRPTCYEAEHEHPTSAPQNKKEI